MTSPAPAPAPQDRKPPVPAPQPPQQPAQRVSAVPIYDSVLADLGDPFDSVENVVMRDQDQRIKEAMARLRELAREEGPVADGSL